MKKICPKCQKLMSYNYYFGVEECKYCGWHQGKEEENMTDEEKYSVAIDDYQKKCALIEEAAEEIENLYGYETELSIRLRAAISGEEI